MIAAIKLHNEKGLNRSTSPSDGDPLSAENDGDWVDDMNDDDDSGAEDSDDDCIDNRLCTFASTQKEFTNQHWYHCHTCKMVDRYGVCSVCARVCHADHDVTYSKHGSFFCDCGAKEDGACSALVKRTSGASGTMREDRRTPPSSTSTALSNTPYSNDNTRNTSPLNSAGQTDKNASAKEDYFVKLRQISRRLEPWANDVLEDVKSSDAISDVLDLLKSLLPVVETLGHKYSAAGRLAELQESLAQLHILEKTCDLSEQLMLPTLGSQEGAFENVRMNYTGDQGQTIRHLLTSHIVRRVVMCCLASGPGGKRQHLVVAHEKGKILVLQLSALLKQADSSQKKLTLSRLASAPVPFTVLSVVSNQCTEEYLAVNGLKDCHVLTFSNNGSVVDHLVLHPQLDANNFIVKTVWMPGTQTELALVTADFIKIYDLGTDVLSPQFYFLVPSGKVRDCTLACMDDGSKYVLIMSTAGHIYFQCLNDESSAVNGPFYVTNIMDVNHPSIKESSSEQIGGGGVSIYYSQSLKCLFFSYFRGKSFMAPLTAITEELKTLFPISIKSSSPSSTNNLNGNKNGATQPLCQWGEIQGHPGLVTAFYQTSNNPVIMMITPDQIQVQEIKVSSKSKIVDMVAIRHNASAHEYKTTIILLCEDGSLKIYMASASATDFWLSPMSHPMSAVIQSKPPRKKKAHKVSRISGVVSFPVDFFEHCSVINDVDFGGSDVLQMYNVQQVKHRLNGASLYIANTKVSGFQMEVTNNDTNQVMVGVRVLVGCQDLGRVPSHIEIFGRILSISNLAMNGSRWFEFPFTREESLQADKKITISFGQSLDPGGVNIIDSVQVYGKTKENFGWPEDHDDFSGTGTSMGTSSAVAFGDLAADPQHVPISSVDRVVTGLLDILDGCFAVQEPSEKIDSQKSSALSVSSHLLTVPVHAKLASSNKTLLASLFPNKASYHTHMDQTILKQAAVAIQEFEDNDKEMNIETYQRLVLTARSVAISRPQNLVKFAEQCVFSPQMKEDCKLKFMEYFAVWFWKLLAEEPTTSSLGAIGSLGFVHVEATVHALIEVIHAFTIVDMETVPFAAKLYAEFLMMEDIQISFAAKHALIRVLRPRLRRRKQQNPPQDVPDSTSAPPHQAPPPAAATNEPPEGPFPEPVAPADPLFDAGQDAGEAVLNVGPRGIRLGGVAGNLDALLPGLVVGNIPPPVLDMPGDVDDEAMVELAIALSLQEQNVEGGEIANLQHGLQGLQQGLQQLANLGPNLEGYPGLQGLAGMLGGGLFPPEAAQGEEESAAADVPEAVAVADAEEPGEAQGNDPSRYSDTTASAPGSDDEGSTTAIEEGAMATPPAEPSEAAPAGTPPTESKNESTAQPSPPTADTPVEGDLEWESYNSKIHALRLKVLDYLTLFLSQLRKVGGVRSIPYMQVLLMLSTDLDGDDDRDNTALDQLLTALIYETTSLLGEDEIEGMAERSNPREFTLVVLRLFSVLMSRSKSWQGKQPQASSDASSNFVSKCTASALIDSGITSQCLSMLRSLLAYWKTKAIDDGSVKIGSTLLKVQPLFAPPDMSPVFPQTVCEKPGARRI